MKSSRKELFGNLPTHQEGLNKGCLDRNKVATQKNLTYTQVSKAYNNWIQIFRIKESNLTFEEYLNKLNFAGLTPDDVGNYHLARYNDEGPYTKNSCRFITARENVQEANHPGPKNQIPWNKGLTKSTDSRVLKGAQKLKLYKNGPVTRVAKGAGF